MTGGTNTVNAGDITGAAVIAGDNNTASTVFTQHPAPQAETVDLKAELAGLRALLADLRAPDRSKLDNALADADAECAKPHPDKQEIADAADRIVRCAKAADDFSEHAEKIGPRIVAVAAWLGPLGRALLSAAGLG